MRERVKTIVDEAVIQRLTSPLTVGIDLQKRWSASGEPPRTRTEVVWAHRMRSGTDPVG